mmetsp:Transcript_45325/g.115229  ORF Transcript_45325/g.115229 Transcript_45325/m.115229 type:complete len:105 (+) Transcript_45325:403-717(+)
MKTAYLARSAELFAVHKASFTMRLQPRLREGCCRYAMPLDPSKRLAVRVEGEDRLEALPGETLQVGLWRSSVAATGSHQSSAVQAVVCSQQDCIWQSGCSCWNS